MVDKLFRTAALDALHHFGIEADGLDLVHISENVTFRVRPRHGGRAIGLRLHRPGYQNLETLRSERTWTRALEAAGIAVPSPVTTPDGHDHVEVTVGDTGERRWVSLFGWLPGELLRDIIASTPDGDGMTAHFHRLGALIGTTHNQAVRWQPPAGFVRPRLDADGLMGERPHWGAFWTYHGLSPAEARLLADMRVTLYAALRDYACSPGCFSMIHADLHPGNVLVDADAFAMIDFDDSAFGWHVFDIAVALLSYQASPDYPRLRDACIAGYRTVRPIADADLRYLPLFLLARGMLQLGWFQERPELPEPVEIRYLAQWVCHQAASFRPPD